jgi:hypothetical protein
MSPFRLLAFHVQASLEAFARRCAAERGEVTIKAILGVAALIVAWKLFPSTFTGFFGYVHDMLFQGIDQAGKTGKVTGPLQDPLHHTQNPSGSAGVAHHVVGSAKPALQKVHHFTH